jgi:hypothetical protein
MRHLPTVEYCGLTIVFSNPSRFDKEHLLSAKSGLWFIHNCLIANGVCPEQCDIRTSNTKILGLLEGTKAILLLGHRSMLEWAGRYPKQYDDYTLNEQRGNPLEHSLPKQSINMLCSYLPQDCMDMQDYEGRLNPLLNGEVSEEEGGFGNYDADNEDEDDGDVKSHGRTKRGNWRFWLMRDSKKLIEKLNGDKKWEFLNDPKPIVYPDLNEICKLLLFTKKDSLYLDIECHPESRTLWCIGFSFHTGPCYVVPVFRYNYTNAYSSVARFFMAIAVAMRDNEVVCHNGFAFDLILLAWRYRIPFGRRNYDTMIAHQRAFPEAEKSLGHGISNFMWEYYHKDEGVFDLHNSEQENKLWHYNAKDVYRMRGLRKAIDKYAETIPGLADSIATGNRCIYPYSLNTLVGIEVDEQRVKETIRENDRKMMQILRCLRLLLGRDFLPTSTKQVPYYLHEEMGYKVVGRTQTGAPACGQASLEKLKLMYQDNPILDIILKYRAVSKETGALKFIPWDFNNPLGAIVTDNNEIQLSPSPE